MKLLLLFKEGGGATQFKQHLIGRGANVKHCGSVPPDVCDFFLSRAS
jgi:hypothetical protein